MRWLTDHTRHFASGLDSTGGASLVAVITGPGRPRPLQFLGYEGRHGDGIRGLGKQPRSAGYSRSPEQSVSYHLAHMPFLWLNIDDSPGHKSLRGMLERNAIALLSNYQRMPLDPPTPSWL